MNNEMKYIGVGFSIGILFVIGFMLILSYKENSYYCETGNYIACKDPWIPIFNM